MLTDLKMFADGTGLSKPQLAELRDSGMIYSDGVQWLLTEQGRKMLTDAIPTWLDKGADEEHSQHYYDHGRNKPYPSEVFQQAGVGVANGISAKDKQVAGDHYKKLGAYQPWEVLSHWLTPEELRGYMKGTVIAYLAREQDKGADTDIAKALHTMQLWEELRKDAQ
jgi:hypothetical protein